MHILKLGYFFNSKLNGYGSSTDSEMEYEGEWKQNLKNGIGIEKFVNNDNYLGVFQDGKRSGVGQFISGSRSVYIGEWESSKFSGTVSQTNIDALGNTEI